MVAPSNPEEARLAAMVRRSANRLAKWRRMFAWWQLGTDEKTPQSQAIRHHREMSMFSRAELSVVVGMLVDRGVFTLAEFNERLSVEADHLTKAYEELFPGVKATDDGLDIDVPAFLATMKEKGLK